MAEPHFAGEDDLPRTFRREREAREREAREREAAMAPPAHQGMPPAGHDFGPPPRDYGPGQHAYAGDMSDAAFAMPAATGTVTRFEVPFGHLVWFFIKAVFAAIPALILLTVLLYAGGQALKSFLPGLRHFEIVIRSPEAAVAPATVAPMPARTPAQPKR